MMLIKSVVISLFFGSMKGASSREILRFFDTSGSLESISASSSDESSFKPPKFLEKFPPWFNNEEIFPNPQKLFDKLPSFLRADKKFNISLLLLTRSKYYDEPIHLPSADPLPQSLQNVNFEKETVFIIHGFMSHGRVEWMFDLAKSYIERRDVNIFLVDWGPGAFVLNYAKAAKNTKKTAKLLIHFIDHLIREKDLSPLGIHIIGHSLGAHIGGFIGKAIPGIQRITGLDPAQPLFTNSKNAMKTRLHKHDAIFVDVIHTNAFFLGCGLPESIGDIDFYMNGGKTQPGCPLNLMNSTYYTKPTYIANFRIDGFLTKISCSHLRAIEYFVESIKDTHCVFIGYRNDTELQKDTNNYSLNDTTVLGLYTFHYPARGDFHIKTNSKSPYCIRQLK